MMRKRFGGQAKFPLVLMLEPLHTCNLHCAGCGRIREYADTLGQTLSVDECLNSITQCGAPIVSICGGEPLLYKGIIELVDRTVQLGKHIYLCTNGQLVPQKVDEFIQLAKTNRQVKSRMYWNIHLDGTTDIHDAVTGKTGSFAAAVEGIAAVKNAGFYAYTNTTLYKNADVAALAALAGQLTALKIDGIMIAPGFGYEAVGQDSFFLTKQEIHTLFKEIRVKLKRFRTTATPLYSDVLCGERELPCAAWANPTRNIKGWRSPCYLIADKHYGTYQELIERTDWTKIGPGKDKRCENCLMHCGFEPAAVLFGNRLRDLLRLGFWQLG
jgi:hopanoid biosynthesis associated radical SAM protein HpnH